MRECAGRLSCITFTHDSARVCMCVFVCVCVCANRPVVSLDPQLPSF